MNNRRAPTPEEILDQSIALLAVMKELFFQQYELTRLLRQYAKAPPSNRCGAPTSMNRPCRGKIEPGFDRCIRHLEYDARADATSPNVLIDLAIGLALQRSKEPAGNAKSMKPRVRGGAASFERLVPVTNAENVSHRCAASAPACGAALDGGRCCQTPIQPGEFRCRPHAAQMRRLRYEATETGQQRPKEAVAPASPEAEET